MTFRRRRARNNYKLLGLPPFVRYRSVTELWTARRRTRSTQDCTFGRESRWKQVRSQPVDFKSRKRFPSPPKIARLQCISNEWQLELTGWLAGKVENQFEEKRRSIPPLKEERQTDRRARASTRWIRSVAAAAADGLNRRRFRKLTFLASCRQSVHRPSML